MDIYEIRLANLRQLIRDRFSGVPRRFALDAEIEPNYVSRLFTTNEQGRKRIGYKNARKWETRYGLPKNWMDQVHTVEDSRADYIAETVAAEAWCKLTIRSWIEAGRMLQRDSTSAPGQMLVPGQYGQDCYVLVVQGDAMIDPATGGGFPDGCYIVVDPTAQARHGSFVIVRHPDTDAATFKQLIHDGARRLLKPLNPRYPITDLDEAEVVGVVREKLLREILPP